MSGGLPLWSASRFNPFRKPEFDCSHPAGVVSARIPNPMSHEPEPVDAPEHRLLHLPLAKPGGDVSRRAA
jgi:hypothetical protein